MLKRLFSLFLIVVICLGFTLPVMADVTPVSTYSDSYVVADAYTGDILFSKDAHGLYEPASCTKILTALVVIEACENTNSSLTLDSQVTVSHDAVWGIDRDSSHIALREGEIVTISELLHGLLIASANDCAVALAEAVGGTVENFCAMMNARAKQLGALNTNFTNPHGLHGDTHKTTAYDLARIMQACVQNETFVRIQSKNYYAVGPTNKSKEAHTFSSVYRMIGGGRYYDSRVVCGKSGYTTQAGNSLATYSFQDDMGLIVITMHSSSEKNAYADTKKLMNYAYDRYHTASLTWPESVDMNTAMGSFTAAVVQKSFVKHTGALGDITTQTGAVNEVLLPIDVAADSLRCETAMDAVCTEIKMGDIVGALNYYSGDTVVASKLLMATSDAVLPEEEKDTPSLLKKAGAFLWSAVKILFVILFVLVVLVLCIRTYNIQKRKKRRQARLEQLRKQRRK